MKLGHHASQAGSGYWSKVAGVKLTLMIPFQVLMLAEKEERLPTAAECRAGGKAPLFVFLPQRCQY